MSTEKDREAIESWVNVRQYQQSPHETYADTLRYGAKWGIQHARQGERELLNRFANKLVTEIYEAVNQHRKFNGVEIIIDEFLEQEGK